VGTSAPSTSPLPGWCAGEGFHRARLIDSGLLPEWLRRNPEVAALGPGTYLLAALSCHRQETADLSTPGDPHGWIAPFARANYYREAILRLRRVVRRLEASVRVPRSSLRLFSNSRLPEKALAAAAGLGSYGRNALVLAPGLGSLFVIAGVFIPAEAGLQEAGREQSGSAGPAEQDAAPAGPPSGVWPLEPGRVCGSCHACQEACPVGALSGAGRLDESRCLQARAGRDGDLSGELAEAWGSRLYGCQVCQEVCPHNRDLVAVAGSAAGELGPSLSLRWVLEPSPEQLAEKLRGTALGMSWISKRAIQRNALLSAVHRARTGFPFGRALIELLERHARSADPQLAVPASRALDELSPSAPRGRP
jgi:epoxyqueuosine reductase